MPITPIMLRHSYLRLAAVALLVPVAGWAADGWAELKPGMSRVEAAALLGRELLASRGRGFEVAIYDGRAEMLFLHGGLVAWTPPGTSASAPSPASAFKFDQQWRPRFVPQSPIDPRAEAGRRPLFLPTHYR